MNLLNYLLIMPNTINDLSDIEDDFSYDDILDELEEDIDILTKELYDAEEKIKKLEDEIDKIKEKIDENFPL